MPEPSIDSIVECMRDAPRVVLHRRDLTASAVLAGLVVGDAGWELLLTRRTDDVEHHKGQISFPGGRLEEGEDPVTGALRESLEEIALSPQRVTVVGLLDDLWTPSGYVITPVLGVVDGLRNLTPNPGEVSRIFSVPLTFLAEDSNMTVKTVNVNGFTRDVYFYTWDGETIWGATAFIIRDLLRRLGLVG